jgi:hypothetical protein
MPLKNQNGQQYPEMIQDVLKLPGVSMDPALLSTMEALFGCSHGAVRLHICDRAASSARSLNAAAYAVGSHIVFGAGRYRPDTPEGFRLLAHELAHVIQQSGASRLQPASVTAPVLDMDLFEREADRVAGSIGAGQSLPPGFAFTPAPFGVVQCHLDVPCPGLASNAKSAKPKEIWMPANDAIEKAYLATPGIAGHAKSIFFGSQYETGRDVRLPSDSPHREFGNYIISRLRGITNQKRPDIIDFERQVIYEIKTVRYAADGMVQLADYYKQTNDIVSEGMRSHRWDKENKSGRRYGTPWHEWDASWYPPHILGLDGSFGKQFVCTQATDHSRFPGVLLYDVREFDDEEKRKRRLRQAVRVDIVDVARAFANVWSAARLQGLVWARRQVCGNVFGL